MSSEFEHLDEASFSSAFSEMPVEPDGLVGGDDEHTETLVRMFSQHQRWLHGYVTSLLGNPVDADDVLQEVSVVFWKEHHNFELGTNFTAWMSVIAYHQVQKHWRKKKRDKLFLSPEILKQIASLPDDFETFENRRKALADCVRQLRPVDQVLIRSYYGERKVTARRVAEELGRPEGTVYKALNRVRHVLFECVSRKMQSEGIA